MSVDLTEARRLAVQARKPRSRNPLRVPIEERIIERDQMHHLLLRRAAFQS